MQTTNTPELHQVTKLSTQLRMTKRLLDKERADAMAYRSTSQELSKRIRTLTGRQYKHIRLLAESEIQRKHAEIEAVNWKRAFLMAKTSREEGDT